jgi:hypothetical protein
MWGAWPPQQSRSERLTRSPPALCPPSCPLGALPVTHTDLTFRTMSTHNPNSICSQRDILLPVVPERLWPDAMDKVVQGANRKLFWNQPVYRVHSPRVQLRVIIDCATVPDAPWPSIQSRAPTRHKSSPSVVRQGGGHLFKKCAMSCYQGRIPVLTATSAASRRLLKAASTRLSRHTQGDDEPGRRIAPLPQSRRF